MDQIRMTAAKIIYSDDCESGGDFRFAIEQVYPEIGMDTIRSLWQEANDGTLVQYLTA